MINYILLKINKKMNQYRRQIYKSNNKFKVYNRTKILFKIINQNNLKIIKIKIRKIMRIKKKIKKFKNKILQKLQMIAIQTKLAKIMINKIKKQQKIRIKKF